MSNQILVEQNVAWLQVTVNYRWIIVVQII
uniref:Uncharacterized protein n=1 Tax=Arundo donax TaxID=35708 RepID=A0A0A9BDB7_ARUDO